MKTGHDVIEKTASACWNRAHPDEDCPEDKIPGKGELVAWAASRQHPQVPPCPPNAVARASELLAALYPHCHDEGGAWHWLEYFEDPPEPPSECKPVRSLDAEIIPEEIIPRPHVEESLLAVFPFREGKRRYGDLAAWWTTPRTTFLATLPEMAATYKALPCDEQQSFPLSPIVAAWQQRPLPVQADTTHPKPLLPKPLAHTQSEKKQYLFSPAFYSAASATQAGEQMTFLPGFGPTAGELETALPLRLFDLGAGIKPRSPAAPVSLRLWVESILATPPARRGRPVEIAPKLGELLAWLYQGKRPMRRDYMAALSRAFNALDSPQARLVYPDRDTGKPTLWRVVSLAAAPVDVKLDDPIRIIVNLPAGSDRGPQINRERLRYWGTRSSAAYRALLNLAYLWYAPGQLQTPANPQKTHWLQAQDPKRYPLLTDGQQTALCYAPTENRKTQQKHIERARHVLAKLAEEDDIRLIDGRILPPASWNV